MARTPFGFTVRRGSALTGSVASTRGSWGGGGRLAGSGMTLDIRVDGAPPGADFAAALRGRLQEEIDERAERIGLAYVEAMKRFVQRGVGKLRADVVSGGFYRAARLAKTWRGTTYPKGGDSLSPAGWFANKARVIIDTFTDGVTIRAHNAQFLAVPLGPAKAIIRRLNTSIQRSGRDSGNGRNAFGKFIKLEDPVARVEQALGVQLIPVIDPKTNTGVLIAEDSRRLTKSGQQSKSKNGPGTPLFALTRDATLKPRIKGRRVLEEIAESFGVEFPRELAALLAPEDR